MGPVSKVFSSEPPTLSKDEQAQFDRLRQVRTTPRDDRFPHQNQAMHCWNRYNQWIVCTTTGGNEEKCKPMRQLADSVCPGDWLEQWDESREAGNFSGVGNRFTAH